MKKYDFIVFIGRMQPPHKAHIQIIENAFKQADNVIVGLGSSKQPRTITNPWSYSERLTMVRNAVTAPKDCKLYTVPLHDFAEDGRWVVDVQKAVSNITSLVNPSVEQPKIGIIGHDKDYSTAYYLKMFPQWGSIKIANIDDLNSSDIRESLFTKSFDDFDEDVGQFLPEEIHDYLKAFTHRPEFDQLVSEDKFIKGYKKSWESAPYAPIFVTCDAIVVQSGHVLLIRRRAEPGKGLWAIPGGFVNPDERIEDGAIRELKEETRIDCPAPVLRGSIKECKVFDKPNRSARGRTITHAYHIELPPGPLHKVKGSDDADKARWVPLNTVREMEDQMFEDHYQIIDYFLG